MSLDFGSEVLTAQELDRVVSRWETEYARTLGKLTLTLKLVRERDMLRFHRAALRQIERSARQAGRAMSSTLRAYRTALAPRARDRM